MDGKLDKRTEGIVNELLNVGGYRSRSDVLRAGVRLLKAESEKQRGKQNLTAMLEAGLGDIEAGRLLTIAGARRKIRLHFEGKSKTAKTQ
jgi:putative addiction module CopG family antidote